MIQDPTDEFIKAINAHYPLAGKTVLEIGCGSGRVTRDLARVASYVIATDTDQDSVEKARGNLLAKNIELRVEPDGLPKSHDKLFDAALYSLSLHHIPTEKMSDHMARAGQLLHQDGVLIVIEPRDGGSFNEAKRRFGAGSGDEGALVAAAREAIESLEGWKIRDTHHFKSGFLFSDAADFCTRKLPDFDKRPRTEQDEILSFLHQHSTAEGISLESERTLYLLTRANKTKKS